MGVRLLYDQGTDGSNVSGACLYCSTSMTAFGPVFMGKEADNFREWHEQYNPRIEGVDLRSISRDEIERLFCAWVALPTCNHCDERFTGEARAATMLGAFRECVCPHCYDSDDRDLGADE
jgi:hypothetical protein